MNLSAPTKVPFRWDLNWKVCLFAACMLPLLVGLGFWQLARAEQKRTLAQTIETEQARPPLAFVRYRSEAEPTGFSYRAVSARGQFIAERYWLVENKVHQGQIGYEVVMPLRVATGETILVNRGWLAGTGYRDRLPDVPTPAGEITVSGWMTNPSINPMLADARTDAGQWPQLALQIDLEAFAHSLELPLWPQLLRLRADSEAALITAWQPIALPATTHQGYAVQWFAMAFTLALLTLIANSNLIAWMKQAHVRSQP